MTELSICANNCGTDKGCDNYICQSDSMSPLNIHYGYTEIYDSYFSHIRETRETVYVLEIGIFHGCSLKMYDEYFGHDKCKIFSMDIEPKTEYETDNTRTFICDQSSRQSIAEFVDKMNAEKIKFDIIIDDGSHASHDQIISLGMLQYLLNDDSIYIIEDLHYNFTSHIDIADFKLNSTIDLLLTCLSRKGIMFDSEYFNLIGKMQYNIIASIPSSIVSSTGLSSACNTAIIKFK